MILEVERKVNADLIPSDVENHLLKVLAIVNDWLKFAEAKNAGLLALGGISLSAILSFISDHDAGSWAMILMTVGIALWICSVCLCMFSFIAVTKITPSGTALRTVIDEEANLYFFMHLAEYSADSLLNALGQMADDTSPRRRFELNLAEQIIQNSRITATKLRLFNSAAVWWITGFLFIVSGVAVSMN